MIAYTVLEHHMQMSSLHLHHRRMLEEKNSGQPLEQDTAKSGLWTLDWTVDWTVDWTRDDHYQSIGLCTGHFGCRQSLYSWAARVVKAYVYKQ